MPYLDSIRVFIRVAELGSITAAGRDRRITSAVASNRIKELERQLGVRLFNRTTRKLALTEVGRVYYDHAARVISAVDEAEAAISEFAATPRGALRVLAPLGIGRRILGPLIPDFSAQYPEIEVRLRLTDRRVDVLEERVDLAFILGQPQDSAMKMRVIAPCPRVLCAAPGYLERHGTPRTPEELISDRHNCLLLRFPGSREYFWTLRQGEGWERFHVAGKWDADDGDVLTDWALAGEGIANRPRYEVADHLRAGRLVEVLAAYRPEASIFACIFPHRRLLDPKVRHFIDHMAAAARDRMKRMDAGAVSPKSG